MTLNAYETVFILPPDYTPQRVDEFIDKIKNMVTKAGGETTLVDKWGRRRLAYPIKRHREGFYTFIQFKAPGTLLAELNTFFRVNEDVVRDILVKALKGKPGSPTMSVPAPMMQSATIPFHRTPNGPGHGPQGHAPGAPSALAAAAPAAVAPAAPAAAPKEEAHEPVAPAPAQ